MKKLLQRIVSTPSLLAFFLCLFIWPLPVHAESNSTLPPVTSTSITAYAFSALPGDSLSRIVRRALQLRAVADPPTAMYCENNISHELGGRYIEVAEQVVVTYDQIDTCVASAKSLDQAQKAAWQAYADTVNFDVSTISPTNNSSTVVAPQPPAAQSQAPTPAPESAPTPPPSPSLPATKPVSPPSKRESKNIWFIVAAIVVLLAFIADGSLVRKRTRSDAL